MWNGVSIGSQYHTLADIAAAARQLVPSTWSDAQLEWLVKAGEGGSWQASFDPHPLAIASEGGLAQLVAEGANLGLDVIPYLVMRGRAEWLTAERAQAKACARIAKRVVLNLEPGLSYFNGIPSVSWVDSWFNRLGEDPSKFELAAIPRSLATATLGGPAVIQAWLSHVARASWECYDAAAADLAPDVALPRVDQWGAPEAPTGSPDWFKYRVPIVQRSRISNWSDSPLASGGMEVWQLDGD